MHVLCSRGTTTMEYDAIIPAVVGLQLRSIHDANTCAVEGIQRMNYGVLEHDKNTCAVEGNILTKLWNTGV